MQLDQLKYLNKEIEILKEQVERTKNQVVTDVVVGSDVEFLRLAHNQYIVEGYNSKLRRLKRKLSCRLRELIVARLGRGSYQQLYPTT